MALHNDFGREGEAKAAAYLREQGYTILERNWRTKRLEIDIICEKDDLLIIVEVKTRRAPEEYPAELLDYLKKKNLRRAAEAYMRMKKIPKELRFDLILVTGACQHIEHIPDAFQVFD